MSATCPRLGFLVRVHEGAAPDDAAGTTPSTLRTALLEEIAALGLEHARVPGPAGEGWALTVWRTGSQADDNDRKAIAAWLGRQPGVMLADVGLLYDLGD
jgi:hypothetical protein